MQEMQETWVRSLDQEDSPGGGHGNPFQYSCLENPVDRKAWQETSLPFSHLGFRFCTKYKRSIQIILNVNIRV